MTGPDYVVSPAALDQIADGIAAVQDELRTLVPYAVTERGSGVERLAAQPGDVGNAGLNTAFVAFCRRWEWGLRAAVHDATVLVDGLRATAATYRRADDDGASLLARAVFDLVGDPTDPGGDSWAEVAAARTPDPRPPDVADVAAPWHDVVDELVEGSFATFIAHALRGDDPPPGSLDDLRPVAQ